ncbi:Alg9-like mannosyltransferase family-domain-containing protein [Gamsiella multidivaricata]|uniref:Alg9-like mannosyltransferase family-domain-containing protein n=1 Tax=Gamsiella multidivaricata TaxID=101098 RepID=UPI00221E652A|nr:Alg9-like mannosyltransferase family-domain-containing protein [Gamsiella multidivaricata]KAI7830234.1 Alg9-like mannosyltransferase family-domain-containing protein [Gamsiella multidivaricata]
MATSGMEDQCNGHPNGHPNNHMRSTSTSANSTTTTTVKDAHGLKAQPKSVQFQNPPSTTTFYTTTYKSTYTSSTCWKSSPTSTSWTPTEVIVHSTVLVLILLHILVAPFTKVEESFNLQAAHDILSFGVSSENIKQYDHLEFPGVVPRTFVGPLLLAAGSWPIMAIARLLGLGSELPKGLLGQIIVRTVLGVFTFLGWHQMSRGVRHQFGRTTGLLFMIVSGVQFHWLFYAGRTLPNTFALILVNVAYSYWMQASSQTSRFVTAQRLLRMIDCLVLSTVLFRSEILLLMGPIILLELAMTRIRLWETVLEGIKAGVVSLAIAVAIDSWFWKQWMWAEGAVFWFNAVEGKSVAWGVSPWYTYFTTLLPKISGLALPLALGAVVIEPRFRRYMLPAGIFVGLYSFLGHKEWRFVIYVVPILNLGAAVTLSWIVKRKTLAYRLLTVVLFGALGLSFLSSVAQSLISSLNYPGGQALQRLHELELPHFHAVATVHIDGAAAETGCSRFGEIGAMATPERRYPWTYSKDESHKKRKDYVQYTHLLTATPELHRHDFEILEQVDGYAGMQRVPLSQIRETCPRAVERFSERLRKASFVDAVTKKELGKVWAGCSPLQVRMEGRIWIMRRFGAAGPDGMKWT